MTDIARTRTRRRQIEVPGAPEPLKTTLEQDVEETFRLKSISADAEKAYDEARKALLARMKEENRPEVVVPARGNRPGIIAKIASKTSNVIDPAGFFKLVTREQFLQCVSIGMTAAKQFVAESALGKITTPVKGSDYADVRTLPKKGRGD